jgi:hypothetical protein
MKILALDISTSSGWALLEKIDVCQTQGQTPKSEVRLLKHGTIINSKKVSEYGTYPWSYYNSAQDMAAKLTDLVSEHSADVIVIEETNKSKARYSQKTLEFIHCMFLHQNQDLNPLCGVQYINTSDWRKVSGVELSKVDKKNNAKLSKAKSTAKKNGTKLDKKKLGIKGRVNKKHKSVLRANELYNLDLKKKDDDQADAILLGTAYAFGVKTCDGT